MPNTKSSDIRYKVLDRCLKRGGYSTSDLMKAVNEELEAQGFKAVSSLNTIRQDLDFLGGSAYPDITIKKHVNGRNVTYSYENPDSSIYKVPFRDEEMIQLMQCLAILSRFEGMPQMDWLQSFLDRARLTINIESDNKQVVGFDDCPYLKGKEYFSILLDAICKKSVLSVGYQSFKSDRVKEVLIHPYYLKEYNKRWFLIGLVHGYDSLTNLAFDRIAYVNKVSGVKFIENDHYDFNDEYFSDIIGVSKQYDDEPVDIIIKVDSKEYPYIETKPIHESQHKISSNTDSVIIGIKVCPNYELEQLLLSFGEGIQVISPTGLRDKIKGRLLSSIAKYESAHIE